MADDVKPIGTIKCLLCGGTQIYPGPRYQNHLINEHGAVFDVEYLIQITLFKKEHDKLPELNDDINKSEKNVENIVKIEPTKIGVETNEAAIQTEEDFLEQVCIILF